MNKKIQKNFNPKISESFQKNFKKIQKFVSFFINYYYVVTLSLRIKKWGPKVEEPILAIWQDSKVLPELQEFDRRNVIEWRFNPPHAPWWGVFYERLIADIKKPLRRMIGRSIVGFEELRMLLSEVEAILTLVL